MNKPMSALDQVLFAGLKADHERLMAEQDPRMREPQTETPAMTDDNFDTLWANFKRSLVEARENRKDYVGEVLGVIGGSIRVSAGSENAAIDIYRNGRSTGIQLTIPELIDVAAHCLLAAEEMKPETNYKPNTPTR